jgi:hypothetical protein
MAKVFGIHTIELHPGVAPEDYIRFVNDELSRLMEDKLGWKISVGLGERGERIFETWGKLRASAGATDYVIQD